jgi:hypothetical protein
MPSNDSERPEQPPSVADDGVAYDSIADEVIATVHSAELGVTSRPNGSPGC